MNAAQSSSGGLPLWLPLLLLFALGITWGCTFSLAKVGVTGGIEPLGYAFWQLSGSAITLLILNALHSGQVPNLRGPYLRYYFLSGLLGLGVPNGILFTVVRELPAGLMSVVVTFAPLMTYLLALLFSMERISLRRASGLLLGFFGAMILVLPGKGLPDPSLLPWVLVGFLTPTFYAIMTVYTARARPPGAASLSLACGMLGAAAVLMLPAALLSGQFYIPHQMPGLAEAALIAHMVLGALAYIAFFEIVRMRGPVFFSQVAFIVTLSGIVWGAIIFDERLPIWAYSAGIVILAGVALVNWKNNKPH